MSTYIVSEDEAFDKARTPFDHMITRNGQDYWCRFLNTDTSDEIGYYEILHNNLVAYTPVIRFRDQDDRDKLLISTIERMESDMVRVYEFEKERLAFVEKRRLEKLAREAAMAESVLAEKAAMAKWDENE